MRRGEGGDGGLDVARCLALGFGALWVLDGLLQFLPQRGGHTLEIMAMTGWGQPNWYLAVVDAIINTIYRHDWMTVFSVTLGLVQLAVGTLVLVGPGRRWGRIGLWTSIPVALGIWFFGEWLGGLAGFWGGGITFVNGGPGAAILYLFGAWILLPAGRVFGQSLLTRVRRVTGGLWIVGALAQSVPALWRGGLSQALYENQVLTHQGFWTRPIAAMVRWTAMPHANAVFNGVFVAVMLVIGLGILLRRDGWALYALAALWVVFVWWIGENFGALFGGVATDPNTGPAWAVLLLPLAAAALSRRQRPVQGGAHGGRDPVSGT